MKGSSGGNVWGDGRMSSGSGGLLRASTPDCSPQTEPTWRGRHSVHMEASTPDCSPQTEPTWRGRHSVHMEGASTPPTWRGRHSDHIDD
ncbi:unnamed protein product [Boreogadus saida]